jgi:HSP20 family protein
MRRQIDEIFGDVFERRGIAPRRGFSPAVDVYYCGDPPKAIVKADLAGISPQEVSIEVRGRQLVISGERRAQESEGRLYQQIEIAHGPFRRIVELGADVQAEQASATYEDGVLRIEIPIAAPEDMVRQIRIRNREGGSQP